MGANLVPYSSQSFKNLIELKPFRKDPNNVLICSFLWKPFSSRYRCPNTYLALSQGAVRGSLLPDGDTRCPLAPCPLSELKPFFFIHTLTFKMPSSRMPIQIVFILNKVLPNSLWLFFIFPLNLGTSAWSTRNGRSPGCSGPTVWTQQPRRCFTKPTYLSRVHPIEAFCLWYGLVLNSVQMVVLSSFIKEAGSFS